MEAHVKLRPVDMATKASIVAARPTAQAALRIHRPGHGCGFPGHHVPVPAEITLSAVTAQVDQERCASCLICVRACPYDVPRINEEGVSEIDEALCRGMRHLRRRVPGQGH